jgi:hypothetical protein
MPDPGPDELLAVGVLGLGQPRCYIYRVLSYRWEEMPRR